MITTDLAPPVKTRTVRFGKVPTEIIRAGIFRDVTRSELAVYIVLAAHANGSDWTCSGLSVRSIADLCEYSERAVELAIERLENSRGLISVVRRRGRGLLSTYTIITSSKPEKAQPHCAISGIEKAQPPCAILTEKRRSPTTEKAQPHCALVRYIRESQKKNTVSMALAAVLDCRSRRTTRRKSGEHSPNAGSLGTSPPSWSDFRTSPLSEFVGPGSNAADPAFGIPRVCLCPSCANPNPRPLHRRRQAAPVA